MILPAPERIRVVTSRHKRVATHELWLDVRRPHPLGNPYVITRVRGIGQSVEAHSVAVARYRGWLQAQIDAKDMAVMNALHALQLFVSRGGQLALQCGCRPLPCHADAIREELLFRLGENFGG